MTTQSATEAIRTDIKTVKDVVDLLDSNVTQILEVLPTLATKDDLNGLEQRLMAAIQNRQGNS